ncbi:CopM family metallochaperone [Limobrevibacterium gyesilva]|uniref:DUF305 domain-containing protein n=1 Tax=Limobrevibacterium gyesilva TaxID=2991712 RepID=A0AA41YKJ7_9PROT|nr:DUF305 domain-containing protein [Limobrevibacterium gyesilva]MCW3474300.1 DUF305 domain-containing protein [Limobrevibacterium gyesilva]
MARARYPHILVIAVAIAVAAGAAVAQAPQPSSQMPMRHGMGAPPAESPATQAYMQGMAKMHHDMDIHYSGDADKDFVAGMIAHHQGAIDMAKVVLQYGSDPEIRKLAQDIVAAQEQEIAFMRAWQAKHP